MNEVLFNVVEKIFNEVVRQHKEAWGRVEDHFVNLIDPEDADDYDHLFIDWEEMHQFDNLIAVVDGHGVTIPIRKSHSYQETINAIESMFNWPFGGGVEYEN